ncbi:MAG: transposase [Micromonosporaceae bacterium]|nr:transposase [Micromonosporaceae bacterium]
MPRSYPPEFRRKVLDLLRAGRSVAQLVRDLQISDQTIYTWRRQELIDTGQLPGTTSREAAELVAARRRIAELETELAVHRRAAELLKETEASSWGSPPRAQGAHRAVVDDGRLTGITPAVNVGRIWTHYRRLNTDPPPWLWILSSRRWPWVCGPGRGL